MDAHSDADQGMGPPVRGAAKHHAELLYTCDRNSEQEHAPQQGRARMCDMRRVRTRCGAAATGLSTLLLAAYWLLLCPLPLPPPPTSSAVASWAALMPACHSGQLARLRAAAAAGLQSAHHGQTHWSCAGTVSRMTMTAHLQDTLSYVQLLVRCTAAWQSSVPR